jgi:hypothetical protein
LGPEIRVADQFPWAPLLSIHVPAIVLPSEEIVPDSVAVYDVSWS